MILYRLIPRWVHNRITLFFYDLLSWRFVFAGSRQTHFDDNLIQFEKELSRAPEGFLENQAELQKIRFGKHGDLSRSGCGAIAVINAMQSLGERVTAQNAARIVQSFEEKGAALGGRLGISPLSIMRYLKRKGYEVQCFYAKDSHAADRYNASFHTFIVSCYNNARNMGDRLHTVNIERRGGGFVVHNGYRKNRADGSYTASEVYPSLADAVSHIDPNHTSQPILMIGIRKPLSRSREFTNPS